MFFKYGKVNSLEAHPLWKEGNEKNLSVLLNLLKRGNIGINTCEHCGKVEFDRRFINVNHKDKDRTNNDLSNLQVLCLPCHRRADDHGFYTDFAKWNGIPKSTAWARFHPKEERERVKKYRLLNPEKAKESNRKQYLKKHEERILKAKEYYQKNKEKVKKLRMERYYKQRGDKHLL